MGALASMELHSGDSASLVRSAERLGYSISAIGGGVADAGAALVLLEKKSGERLVLDSMGNGGVVVHALEGGHVHELVRQRSLEQVQEHFAAQGMGVESRTTASGEVELVASERGPAKPDGSAQVTAEVQTDGTVIVDVDRILGPRCSKIVNGVAQAVGGQVVAAREKAAFYALPRVQAKARVTA